MALEISSDVFTWMDRQRSWVAELSDLRGELERQGLISLDIQNGKQSFWMISSKTGAKRLFVEGKHNYCQSGEDLLSIEFTSEGLWGYKVVLFND